MPTVFILLIVSLALCVACYWSDATWSRHPKVPASVSGLVLLVGILSGLMAFCSLIVSGVWVYRNENVSVPFRVEKTPYRIVVVTASGEIPFTDAYHVFNADSIIDVREEIGYNAWGGRARYRLNVVFRDGQ